MGLRANGKCCIINEQILEDPASGLTFQFELREDGTTAMRFFGESLPFGNREIIFDKDGVEIGAGTVTRGLCKPCWPGPLE